MLVTARCQTRPGVSNTRKLADAVVGHRVTPNLEQPMTDAELAAYQARLESLLTELHAHSASGAEDRRTVELDQQSVGRLSRMDALQRQAMAKATEARRAGLEKRIRAALARIAAGEFGYCGDCGDEIAQRRLDLDPTVPTCISCAR